MKRIRTKLAVGAAAALVVTGGSAAFAATHGEQAPRQGERPHSGPCADGGGHGPRAGLGAAATFLGLDEAALRERLRTGETLGDVAKAESRAVDGLVGAIVAAEKAALGDAVAAGRISEAHRDRIVDGLEARVTERVNEGLRGHRLRGGHGPGA